MVQGEPNAAGTQEMVETQEEPNGAARPAENGAATLTQAKVEAWRSLELLPWIHFN